MNHPSTRLSDVCACGTSTVVRRQISLAQRQAKDEFLHSLAPSAVPQWLEHQGFPGIDARDENGETPLMRAARLGNDSVLAALLACGAQTDTLDDNGNHALWFACLHGNPSCIRLLVEAGLSVDHTNDDDITCIMQAAASGRVDVMRWLLFYGASTHQFAPDGRNALDLSVDLGLALMRLTHRITVNTAPEPV